MSLFFSTRYRSRRLLSIPGAFSAIEPPKTAVVVAAIERDESDELKEYAWAVLTFAQLVGGEGFGTFRGSFHSSVDLKSSSERGLSIRC